MCQVLQEHHYDISPATYYRYQDRSFGPTAAEIEQAYQAHRVYQLWETNRRVYGYRKLWVAARRSGWSVGRDHVRRLMRVLGISGVSRGKMVRTTVADPRASWFEDRIQRARKQAQRPNQWWVADFPYVRTRKGFCYVSFMTDVFTREILGFVVDVKPDSSLVVRALRQALAGRRRVDPGFSSAGVIHHSDAGSQYTSSDFRSLLARHDMEGSIGSVDDA
ncbi:integrase family protein [Corynebacterium uterequi]|uniref:Integrase family protein n=2 Tax=Corynebacterium uterequi TaxID=1072256 RepID=A0A0G3HEK9_9CORY|nr:integrase family protein [Corynebacterium uterequi]